MIKGGKLFKFHWIGLVYFYLHFCASSPQPVRLFAGAKSRCTGDSNVFETDEKIVKTLPRNLAGRWNLTSEESRKTEEGGKKHTDLLFGLSALTDCSLHLSVCVQWWVCVHACLRADRPCVWELFFLLLPRQSSYSWLSRIVSLQGIKRT